MFYGAEVQTFQFSSKFLEEKMHELWENKQTYLKKKTMQMPGATHHSRNIIKLSSFKSI